MSYKRPDKVTGVESTTEPPYIKLVERREERRDRAIGAGLFAVLTAVGLLAGASALPAITAAIGAWLANDWANWEYKYDHPPERPTGVDR